MSKEINPATFLGATIADVPFLWRMLTYAASMSPGGDDSIAAARADDSLRTYVEGWGRSGDLGIVAIRNGERAGACWVRLGDGDQHPFKLSDARIPELAMGVMPDQRGSGLGGAMLRELTRLSRGRYPAIVLSVREHNPAVHLYERAGFRTTRSLHNRVGGLSLVMQLDLEDGDTAR